MRKRWTFPPICGSNGRRPGKGSTLPMHGLPLPRSGYLVPYLPTTATLTGSPTLRSLGRPLHDHSPPNSMSSTPPRIRRVGCWSGLGGPTCTVTPSRRSAETSATYCLRATAAGGAVATQSLALGVSDGQRHRRAGAGERHRSWPATRPCMSTSPTVCPSTIARAAVGGRAPSASLTSTIPKSGLNEFVVTTQFRVRRASSTSSATAGQPRRRRAHGHPGPGALRQRHPACRDGGQVAHPREGVADQGRPAAAALPGGGTGVAGGRRTGAIPLQPAMRGPQRCRGVLRRHGCA